MTDPLGLLNPTKLASSVGNAINAGRLYAAGVLKIGAGIGLEGTGVGAGPGVGLTAWGVWNLKAGQSATNRSLKQWGEAWCEDWGDWSFRNLAGVLPFGDRYDDPGEPTPWHLAGDLWNKAKTDTWEFLGEVGTFFHDRVRCRPNRCLNRHCTLLCCMGDA